MTFKNEFLKHYLKSGMGSFSKRDIDVLIMHLLDEGGIDDDSEPLKNLTNQQASFALRMPVAKIKSLRYEAALKYRPDLEGHAKWEMLKVLAKSKFEADQDRICFVIEDGLTKNWIQGTLKENGLIFDNSFNSEIVKVSTEDFCAVLEAIYKGASFDINVLILKNQKSQNIERNSRSKKNIYKSCGWGSRRGCS